MYPLQRQLLGILEVDYYIIFSFQVQEFHSLQRGMNSMNAFMEKLLLLELKQEVQI